jgi:hypothetical protein
VSIIHVLIILNVDTEHCKYTCICHDVHDNWKIAEFALNNNQSLSCKQVTSVSFVHVLIILNVDTEHCRYVTSDWLLLNVKRAVFQLYSGGEQVQ